MNNSNKPLAYRLRPQRLDDIVGQDHLVGKGAFLRRAIERDELFSMILYGPPGCGKTSLAAVIALATKAEFAVVNAVAAGIKDLKAVVELSHKKQDGLFRERTIMFIDEIHRFNKKQQDYLLPSVEKGVVTLIGATTENPSFEVNSALLSRCQVFVLKALDDKSIEKIISNGLKQLGREKDVKKEILQFVARYAHGDARFAINILEQLLRELDQGKKLTKDLAKEIMQKKALMYDKNGEEHYNIISALHKSMRDSDPDAAAYWTMRMVEGGEDPKYIVRRMIRFASEDIGNADPKALEVAVAAKQAVEFIGLPECNTALIQCATYLAKAPKDNSCYRAVKLVQRDIAEHGPLPVPFHLRNAPTKLMKEWGYGKGYKYAHEYKDAKVDQKHLPEKLEGKKYYF
ncbi:MAG TPA: replication-associated recombination protein A [Candidatus Peregrinibacteria bacterium]|nr:replication-associated recombination protein A [Candidatus Peregrinibacteria bacterium]